MDTTVWIHTKTQTEYEIKDFGIDEAKMEPVVIYYPTGKPDTIWVRSAREFFDGRFRQATRGKGQLGATAKALGLKPNFGPGMTEEDSTRIARRDSVAMRPTGAEQIGVNPDG